MTKKEIDFLGVGLGIVLEGEGESVGEVKASDETKRRAKERQAEDRGEWVWLRWAVGALSGLTESAAARLTTRCTCIE